MWREGFMNLWHIGKRLVQPVAVVSLTLGVTCASGPSTAVAASHTSPHSARTFVHGTFRTPEGTVAECPGVPPGTDCQIDKFFGDIGGPDNGTNLGADDKLTTVFIHEDVPVPGFWTYRDLE